MENIKIGIIAKTPIGKIEISDLLPTTTFADFLNQISSKTSLF